MRQYLTEQKHSAGVAAQLLRRTATVAMGAQPDAWSNLQTQLIALDALINGGQLRTCPRNEHTPPLIEDTSALAAPGTWVCPIGDALAWMALRSDGIDARLWTPTGGGQP
jgi:hypothetical protein